MAAVEDLGERVRRVCRGLALLCLRRVCRGLALLDLEVGMDTERRDNLVLSHRVVGREC